MKGATLLHHDPHPTATPEARPPAADALPATALSELSRRGFPRGSHSPGSDLVNALVVE